MDDEGRSYSNPTFKFMTSRRRDMSGYWVDSPKRNFRGIGNKTKEEESESSENKGNEWCEKFTEKRILY